jgi:uncharacterized protein with GYD domain
MHTYLLLVKWSEDGVRDVKSTFDRVEKTKTLAEQHGCRFHTYYWTQGRYDFVALLDAPDDATAAALVLKASETGAIRTESLRAFDETEMRTIVERLG